LFGLNQFQGKAFFEVTLAAEKISFQALFNNYAAAIFQYKGDTQFVCPRNHGYWWEAHEALETVWFAAGHKSTDCGIFVQGLIQLAGAQLKRFIDEPRGAQSLTRSGIEKISFVEGVYLGIEVVSLVEDVEGCLKENCGVYPRIELSF